MPLYVLDTDHLSLIQRSDAKVSVRFLATPRSDVAASVVSFEEQMRGWLAHINQARTPDQICLAYDLLCTTQHFYCTLRLLEFDANTAKVFKALRQKHRRLSTMDLRIAATALAHDATLVTRNTQDFISIANLRLDNWA
jgi:tRNA(fMet)-specific endonuclease VapC